LKRDDAKALELLLLLLLLRVCVGKGLKGLWMKKKLVEAFCATSFLFCSSLDFGFVSE
jgi:hypothetical protein